MQRGAQLVLVVLALLGAVRVPAWADEPRQLPRIVREPATMRAAAPGFGRPAGPARETAAVPPPTAIELPVLIEGPWYRIRAQAGMDGVAAEAARRLPASFERIAADLAGLPIPAHVELRLVRDTVDLVHTAPPGRGAPAWANGVAWPDLGVMAVAARRGAEPIDLRSTLDHELAHLALGAALGGRAPRWLDEGFAYVHSADFSLGRTGTLTGMAWSGDPIPLAELDRYFHGSEDATSRAYAQAYDMVAFLARRGRYPDAADDGDRWPFRDFLAQLAAGRTLDEATRESFASPVRDLYREWYEALRQRYLMVPLEMFGVALWVLAAGFLVIAFIKKRRANRRRLAAWAIEEASREAAARAAAASLTAVP